MTIEEVSFVEIVDVEFVDVKFNNPNTNFTTIIACVYIPPDSSRSEYKTLYRNIQYFLLYNSEHYNILILDDFSLPVFRCDTSIYRNENVNELISFMEVNRMNLYNSITNNLGKTLDILANSNMNVTVKNH